MRWTRSWSLVVVFLVASSLQSMPAGAVQTAQDVVVNQDPANFTPNVLDGKVMAIAQVGDQILLGGTFSQVQPAGGATTLARRNLLSFNAATGALSTSFAPAPDGEVRAIIPSGDGTSVFVGGVFNNISGTSSRKLAKINATTGAVITGFRAPRVDGHIKDLRLAGGRLWIAGTFSAVAGNAQRGLATINPSTGAFDPYMRLGIAGVHWPDKTGQVTHVAKIDVNPSGTRLAAIGNFDTVAGVRNHQMAMLNLAGSAATLASWQTNFYTAGCSRTFETYLRDLDISPDGSYVVVSTTGAYGGSTSPCDTTARFEVGATGTDLKPTWVGYTGGDTTYAVAVTGTAVYVGGHQRWQNNPLSADRAGPGAVSRQGIAALDPANGLPLSWNPTRTRGVGVFDMLATSTGLWVGSDTDRIGSAYEYRARIAFFPVAGGKVILATRTPSLPGDVLLAGTRGKDADSVFQRSFTGTTAGAPVAISDGGRRWGSSQGAFMWNGTLYATWSDGTFTRQAFDGSTYGPAVPVNTADLLVPLATWQSDIKQMTGLFFDGGRVYFTLAGSPALYYRYFTPESDVVGAQRFTASGNVSGVDFSTVQGMFRAGPHLYWTTSDGLLRRTNWSGTGPVAGTTIAVSGAGAGWAARSTFVFQS